MLQFCVKPFTVLVCKPCTAKFVFDFILFLISVNTLLLVCVGRRQRSNCLGWGSLLPMSQRSDCRFLGHLTDDWTANCNKSPGGFKLIEATVIGELLGLCDLVFVLKYSVNCELETLMRCHLKKTQGTKKTASPMHVVIIACWTVFQHQRI